MLNSSESQYVKNLLLNYYNNGYTNYVCITDSLEESNFNVFCYVSKDTIINENNHFTLETGKKISLNLNDSTSTNRLDVDNLISTTSILQDNTEFIYSNIEYYPDFLGNYRTSLNNHLDLNFAYLLACLLLIPILVNFLKSCFRTRS